MKPLKGDLHLLQASNVKQNHHTFEYHVWNLIQVPLDGVGKGFNKTLILREALFNSVSFEAYSASNGLDVGWLGFTYDANEAIRQYLQDDTVLCEQVCLLVTGP